MHFLHRALEVCNSSLFEPTTFPTWNTSRIVDNGKGRAHDFTISAYYILNFDSSAQSVTAHNVADCQKECQKEDYCEVFFYYPRRVQK